MAKRDSVQYVRYYAPGTEAHAIEPEQPKRRPRPAPKTKLPPKPIAQRKTIEMDPVPVVGTAVAVVLLIWVIVMLGNVIQTGNEIAVMEHNIAVLNRQQEALEQEYHAGYDLEEIRNAAQSMGLVPIEQVEHITIALPEPEVTVELSWWEQLWQDIVFLFGA